MGWYCKNWCRSNQKELDDNDVDYNEQDLKDAWGIKENLEEENIGIKRRITDKRREELGLNAVTLPKIADNNSAMNLQQTHLTA